MSIFRKLFGSKRPPPPPHVPFTAALEPDMRFFAVGDIHGELGALERLLTAIRAQDAEAPIVFVGDYVDRGEQSADVLRKLMTLSTAQSDKHICLMGNHEQMFLRFLEDPEENGDRWLSYGGLQTVASFGVGRAAGAGHTGLRDNLAAAMGQDMIAWLRRLALRWQTGNVAVVHAGADPQVPLELQRDSSLIWGHRMFERLNRSDGVWVVHGHTIVDQPQAKEGRIAVDTGAYATGRLTAACVEPGGVTFLSS